MSFKKALELHKNWSLIKVWGTKKWIVDRAFIWYLDYPNKKYPIKVPKWFETDFWSIPKIIQNIFSPTKYISYILHDRLYKDPLIFNSVLGYKCLSRKECDLILVRWLYHEWALFFERLCIYLWVRFWGWLFYNK